MKAINKSQILPFLRHLDKNYDVYLPIKKDSDWIFDRFDPTSEKVDLLSPITLLPPKKFFIPSGENLFCLKNEEINYSVNKIKPIALVGINSFDLKALILLDQIMSRPYVDPYYWKRRKNTLLIGIGQNRINIANYGYDLFFEEHEDYYLVITGTNRGKKITNTRFFQTSQKSEKKILSTNEPLFQQINKIQKAIRESYRGKIWKKIAETCFGCGICAYVCPLCYCYEYEDSFCTTPEVKEVYTSGVLCASCRTKRWDACFLPDFFAVAGHNFRENLPERIYNWYHHKFVRMPQEYGQIGCVNCGRCIKYCPARINFKEVLKELI